MGRVVNSLKERPDTFFMMKAIVVGVVLALVAACSRDEAFGDGNTMTCGSVIKLQHVSSGFRLHSHEVKYGSGSGQQSVTAYSTGDDHNSYWLVQGADNTECAQGTPVKNGDVIRLMHVSTKRNLHSHAVMSPLTHQKEVSCFGEEGEGDQGDNWVVEVRGSSVWDRSKPVKLKHQVTGNYLTTAKSAMFNDRNCGQGCPIGGQLEVSASSSGSDWKTLEGVYFAPRDHDDGL